MTDNPQTCCPGVTDQGLPGTTHWFLWHTRGAIDLSLSLTWALTDDLHAARSFLQEHPEETALCPA